jgi:hypothetical protein
MSVRVIQHGFAAGELSPSLFARTDYPKYKAGASRVRNYFVDYRGGVISRPGTAFVGFVGTDNYPVRLIPFSFNDAQNYILELGQNYMRVIILGAVVQAGGGGDYVLATPWAADDLARLKFTQSADTMTFTHPNYAPYDLTRSASNVWNLAQITFQTTQLAPTGGAATPTHGTEAAGSGDATTTTYRYVVTSISGDGGEESLPSAAFGNAANSRIMSQDGNAYMTLTWTMATGATLYNIYRQEEVPNGTPTSGALFGQIGSTTSTTYQDRNGAPVFTQTPPEGTNPFSGGKNPGTVCYFQQRKTFGGSNSKPATFNMTQIGLYQNMNISTPPKDSDAITGTINTQQVNAIKHMVPTESNLIVLTSGGIFQITGGGPDSAVTPASIHSHPQAATGANDVPPIKIGYELLFVQSQGSTVRDLSYDFYKNIYTGTDISVLSDHLFSGRQIKEWAWAEEPHKLLWVVRDDGVLLSLTYLKEQEVCAWARHDTQGQYISVASIREGAEIGVYVVVKRLIGGVWRQMIERFASRNMGANAALGIPADPVNAWCVDAGLSLPQTAPAASLLISASSGTATFTASAAVFTVGMIGQIVRVGGGIATLTAYTDSTHMTGVFSREMTAVMPNDPTNTPLPVASGNWTAVAPVSTVTGLSHLEGKTVSILADGAVMTPRVVSGGAVTLDAPATVVVVGLGFTTQLWTMRLDTGEGPGGTIQGRRKNTGDVSVRVQDTGGGLKVATSPDKLVPIKYRTSAISLGTALPLTNDDQFINTDPSWDVDGMLYFECTDPVPTSILGVSVSVEVGDQGR